MEGYFIVPWKNSEEYEEMADMLEVMKALAKGISKTGCPKFGGNLVMRQGKYGNFQGCSNYPKCR